MPTPGASAPVGGPSAPRDAKDAKLAMWKDALYEKCRDVVPESGLFSQEDLLALDVIPNRDSEMLLRVLQSLTDEKLFVTMRDSAGRLTWKWRDSQEAHKYNQCSTDEQVMVYSLIDDAGGDGIWSQTIIRRLNMHDSVLKLALKQLQAKDLIAPFKSVEHPNKKMFIKASIRPSERATGGPWYTDQNLDEPFIEELQKVIFDFVKRQSSYHSTHGGGSGGASGGRSQAPKKGVLKGGVASEKGRKRDASELNEPPSKAIKTSGMESASRKNALLPLPAGYTAYPTVRDIARLLSASGITNNTILSEEDVKKLVDVLVWDSLIEPVKIAGKVGYRVSRVAKQSTESWAGRDDPTGRDGGPEPVVSAYTEAPCGKCPVFDLCEEGGPVGPSNCEYFKRWLGVD